jgi:hypothetical protein
MSNVARSFRTWAVALMVAISLAGCAVIPTHGPVGKSESVPGNSSPVNIDFRQSAPTKGASPTSIIEGFIAAGTGVADDFQVARQYLTLGTATSWRADQRTLVYDGALDITKAGESDDGDLYTVSLDVTSTVDADGIRTPTGANTTQAVSFALIMVDGEWRISSAPDGIMLQVANFAALYSSYSLYFYDPAFTYAVPDVRWFSGKAATTATSLVRAVLHGPAPYLRGAVASAFPDGMQLSRDSVPVNSGVAQVDLTPDLLLGASVQARQQMQAQLMLTLRNLNTVTSVTLRADTRSVDMGGQSQGPPSAVVNNLVPDRQIAIRSGDLVRFEGGQATPIDGVPSMAKYGATAPAMSWTKNEYAFLNADHSQLLTVAAGRAEQLAASAPNLTAPSFSPFDWIWTAAGDRSGDVLVVKPDPGPSGALEPPVVLRVQWLIGRTVTSLRVSRDGSRVLVVSEQNGSSTVHVAGILRTDGVAKGLTDPIVVPATTNPSVAVWLDGTAVAAARSGSGSVPVEVLDLRADPVQLTALDDVQGLSAGNGPTQIFAQTGQGLYARQGNGWVLADKDITAAAFAG